MLGTVNDVVATYTLHPQTKNLSVQGDRRMAKLPVTTTSSGKFDFFSLNLRRK